MMNNHLNEIRALAVPTTDAMRHYPIHWCDNEDGNENTDNSNYRDICDRQTDTNPPETMI